MKNPKASVVQMTSCADVMKNLSVVKKLVEACSKDAQLVVLPEMFPLFCADPTEKVRMAETYQEGYIQHFLKNLARENNIWIVGGSIPIKAKSKDHIFSSCIVYDADGKNVARYDKTHLFDVCVEEGVEEYKESDTVEPGSGDIIVVDTPIGKLGLGICYDIRFPIMFQALLHKGAEIIALPSAFTVKTGAAHWEILSRARCIENMCYGLFSCQTGVHYADRSTYGHSMIVDPWGKMLCKMEEGTDFITSEIDLQYLMEVRKNMPVLQHQKIFSITS